MSSPHPDPATTTSVRAATPAAAHPGPANSANTEHDPDNWTQSEAAQTGTAWQGVGRRNPTRSAFSPDVQKLAVTAVAELLAGTNLSLTSAAAEVAANIGAGTSSVLRWCKAASVTRETALLAHEREWQARVSVLRDLNSRLAAVASGHDLPERTAHHPVSDHG